MILNWQQLPSLPTAQQSLSYSCNRRMVMNRTVMMMTMIKNSMLILMVESWRNLMTVSLYHFGYETLIWIFLCPMRLRLHALPHVECFSLRMHDTLVSLTERKIDIISSVFSIHSNLFVHWIWLTLTLSQIKLAISSIRAPESRSSPLYLYAK